mmetsp:Transcript_2329/g.6670  ORF Transcript_2329/g.6670 Transcript_2329/m.6670 type:complete len:120 (-) Transcript_2329:9107-9466(-)
MNRSASIAIFGTTDQVLDGTSRALTDPLGSIGLDNVVQPRSHYLNGVFEPFLSVSPLIAVRPLSATFMFVMGIPVSTVLDLTSCHFPQTSNLITKKLNRSLDSVVISFFFFFVVVVFGL